MLCNRLAVMSSGFHAPETSGCFLDETSPPGKALGGEGGVPVFSLHALFLWWAAFEMGGRGKRLFALHSTAVQFPSPLRLPDSHIRFGHRPQ